ncbi:site-2 protease family protein [Endomicrobium proavitum]|uniref:Peptidase M50 n=1 Tax=Endomicrobium proavitum TaxID=1408281 RepID=A0A0G3WFW5_9BACT|nr:site-2 protease family protein [Endomicrobium proavitum]AKL97506.1 Peptidase M50 [Endomicrobium proavitum]
MDFLVIFIYVVVILFSVIIHEVAHGLAAYWRGDDTAKLAGRLTLNPIVHIDLFGSIILPAMLILLHTPIFFAWAKPVPFNPVKLKNPKTDIPLVSAAGPLSNIFLAVLSGLIIRIVNAFPELFAGFASSITEFFGLMLMINIVLPVINLIPVPPLDGSKVVTYFMPREIAVRYMNINPYLGLLVLFVLLYSGAVWKIIAPLINFCVTILSGQPLYY